MSMNEKEITKTKINDDVKNPETTATKLNTTDIGPVENAANIFMPKTQDKGKSIISEAVSEAGKLAEHKPHSLKDIAREAKDEAKKIAHEVLDGSKSAKEIKQEIKDEVKKLGHETVDAIKAKIHGRGEGTAEAQTSKHKTSGESTTEAQTSKHKTSGESTTEAQKSFFKGSENGKSDTTGDEMVTQANKHNSKEEQQKNIIKLQEHYKDKLETGAKVVGYGEYTGKDGEKHNALLIKGSDGKQHAVDPKTGKEIPGATEQQKLGWKMGKTAREIPPMTAKDTTEA